MSPESNGPVSIGSEEKHRGLAIKHCVIARPDPIAHYGAWKASPGKFRSLYPTHRSICHHYAAHFTRLKSAGTPIGRHELRIACHALAENATLVTHSTGEFERVLGLTVVSWVAS